MDILFSHKYKYAIHDSLDSVRNEVKSLIGRRWYDFSTNMMGRFNDDDSFTMTQKSGVFYVQWIEMAAAYLSGSLEFNDNKTIIHISVRPNSFFVLLFYLILILLGCELFGHSMFVGNTKFVALILFPLFDLILYGLMRLSTLQLKDRFERLLYLKRIK